MTTLESIKLKHDQNVDLKENRDRDFSQDGAGGGAGGPGGIGWVFLLLGLLEGFAISCTGMLYYSKNLIMLFRGFADQFV